jgi:hypothetical protein
MRQPPALLLLLAATLAAAPRVALALSVWVDAAGPRLPDVRLGAGVPSLLPGGPETLWWRRGMHLENGRKAPRVLMGGY